MVVSSAAVAQTVKAEPIEERASLLQRLSSPTAIKALAPDWSNQITSALTSIPGIAPTSTTTASAGLVEEGSPATNKPVVPGTAAAGGQILTGGVNPQKIYIGNLPQSATLADLEDCFGQFGPCTCAIKRGFGFAFIFEAYCAKFYARQEFASPEHAKAAVAKYHQGHFLGSQITVQLSHERIYLGKKSDSSKETRPPLVPTKASQGPPAPASQPTAGQDTTEPTPKPKTAPISAATVEPIETLPPLRFVMDHVGPPAQAAPAPPQISPGVYERSDRYVPLLPGAAPPVPRARAVGRADEVHSAFASAYPEAYPPAPAYNPEPVPRFDHRTDPHVDPRTATATVPRALEYAYRANLDAHPYQQQHPPQSSYDRNPPPESLYDYDRALSTPVRGAVPYPPFPDRHRLASRSEPLPTPLRAPSPPPPAAYYAAPPPQHYPPREPPASRQYSYQEPNYPRSRDYDGFDHYDPRQPTASHPYESQAYLPAGLTHSLPPRDRDEGRHDARAGPVRDYARDAARAGPVRDYARDAARYQPYGRSLPPPSHLTLSSSTSTVRDSPFGAVGTPVPHAPDSNFARSAGDERRYVDSSYGARAQVDHDWPDWGASYARR